jgi:hypothetical protein
MHSGNLNTFISTLEINSNTYPAGVGVQVVRNLASSQNVPLNEITKVQINI